MTLDRPARTLPERIQRKRTKGWRMPEGAIYVGRPTKWGNPFNYPTAVEMGYLRRDDPDFVVCEFLTTWFREWLDGTTTGWPDGEELRKTIRRDLPLLRGSPLVCWCPLNHDCHADVLLEIANR
jgi:hypothetical protein